MPSGSPDQSKSGPSTAPRGRFFARRSVRAVLITLASIAAMLAVIVAVENWRGKRAWETYRRQVEARGEHLNFDSFLPKPVPPDQNFLATPFLAPLLDYEIIDGAVRWHDSNAVARISRVSIGSAATSLHNWQRGESTDLVRAQDELRSDQSFPARAQAATPAQDILLALEKYAQVFTELHRACARPYAIFPGKAGETTEAAVTQFSALKGLSQATILRASANLEEKRTAEALADVELAFRLSETLQSKPLLISYIVRVSMLRNALQPIWEGLVKGRWTDSDLRRLQQLLLSNKPLEEYGYAMQGERAFSCDFMTRIIGGQFPGGPSRPFQKSRATLPKGMLYQNQVAVCQVFDHCIFPSVNAVQHRVYPEKSGADALVAAIGRPTFSNQFARLLFPAIQKSSLQCAVSQAGVDLALVACALERFRLAHGAYPDSLQALAPQFLDKVPLDVIGGNPLIYEHAPAGSFALRSVGWNGVDDGGEVAARNAGVNIERGDWVWQ